MTELKPCPFCGEKVKRHKNAVECNTCGYVLIYSGIQFYKGFFGWSNKRYEMMEAAWNKRSEVIRCKYCKYSIDFYDDGDCYCRRPNRALEWVGDWDFYCKAAERRQDDKH